MSGQWPPDWEDGDDAGAETGQADAAADARLSEVSAYLAALPRPALPDAVESRISAAIAAEATARTQGTAEAGSATTGGRTLGSPPRRPKVRRSRKFRVRAISSVTACLVLALFGYLLTLTGGSSSSSSAPSAAAGSAATAASAAQHARASRAGARVAEPLPAAASKPSASQSAPFSVTVRGDAYDKSTLAGQVRERLIASQQLNSGAAGAGTAPSAALVGCVLHLTGNIPPGLVDEATYAGEPVYVIAVSNHAWVVGRGCTATHPELITSVSLPGISAP